MSLERFRFGDFTFDPGERLLVRAGERLEIGGRYLDALALLLNERGRLVTKERFMDEVWRGVPVTDEALTQCIRVLRRKLGDEAGNPRFVETVPKHGYRFIAEVEPIAIPAATPDGSRDRGWRFEVQPMLRTAGVAAIGGGVAGIGGGIFYGLAASPPSPGEGGRAISILLVLLAVGMLLGLAGGFGVGAGIAAGRQVPGARWQGSAAGGMLGGLITGGIAKLLGLDAFALLLGRSPTGMTGPAEGALLGTALGLGAWLAARRRLSPARGAALGGAFGAAAGLLVPLLGGHLLGGSLELLVRRFPDSRFRLDGIGSLLGEHGFGPIAEVLTASLEGGLFGCCVVGALCLARGRAAGGKAVAAG